MDPSRIAADLGAAPVAPDVASRVPLLRRQILRHAWVSALVPWRR